MTIHQIKSQLSILTVLSYYKLNPNKNGMLQCPFHSDKKASMKVYPKTNTVYCFAGSCKIEHLDVIDFIMHMEKSTKHEAILKAKSLCGYAAPQINLSNHQNKATMNTTPTHHQQFKRYEKSLHNEKLAQEYCESRCLDWRLLEIGFKSKHTKTKWGRQCLIFPLLDEDGNIAGFYGRSIVRSAKGGVHYYETGRTGLYPAYPLKSTKVLLLTESIIDAATLQTLSLPLENYALLSLYGTNGLTDEHLKAIKRLVSLEEIVFCLDGDEAGREAMGLHKMTLNHLKSGLKMSYLDLPEEEDINSLAMSHEHHDHLYDKLVKERKQLGQKGEQAPASQAAQTEKLVAKLNTTDESNLIYITSTARYYIKGGLRSSGKDLQHMKITLVVENSRGRKSRNGVDLYEDRQVEKLARHIGERLGLRPDLVELDLQGLTDALETYRKNQLKGGGHETEKQVAITTNRKEELTNFWKAKNVFMQIDQLLEKLGIVGEANNRRLGFCIVSSPRMPEPLHGLIQGSSGSGKTHLLQILCSVVPPEWYIAITRATDNTFYNYGKYELSHKLISIEDKDALSEDANLSFRELQSNEKVSQSTTGQDESGNNRSYVKWVFGPIASLACTTKGELYLDDMNRCFLLAIDESAEQTKRVLDYLKRRAAGGVDKEEQEATREFIRDALRLLKSYEVVIPQAPQLSLPPDVRDERRLNGLYLKLVKQITLLHQYQRSKDKKGRLIATKEDLKLANEIMFDAIVLKVDELHGPLRSFYERLKAYIKKEAGEQGEKYSFRQREIRQAMRLSKTSLYRFFKELLEMEYLEIRSGSEHRGYIYQISYWDDNEGMRARIQKYLAAQIDQLKG